MMTQTLNTPYQQPEEEEQGVIGKKFLKKLMRSNFKLYYSTPQLNDILYLHYKSFKKIDNLEAFTGLKVIYLEGNHIKKIQNLDKLTNLRSLYLQQNVIETIEGLDELTQISNLNLSDNMIQRIQGLSKLTRLTNLLIKNNRIGGEGLDDVKGLLECPSISCLDIQSNKIGEVAFVDQVLAKMENIAVVYLQNNQFNKQISHYRKVLITKIPALKYIDDKPIFEDEKRYAEAWGRGGLAEERLQRELYKKEQEETQLRQHREFRAMMERYREEGRRQRENKEKQSSDSESINDSTSKDESLETYKTPEEMSEKTPENQSEESKSHVNESVKDSESERLSEKQVSDSEVKSQQSQKKEISGNDLDELD